MKYDSTESRAKIDATLYQCSSGLLPKRGEYDR